MKIKVMGNYIYEFINKGNEIIYIGKTTNLNRRIRNHILDKCWFNEVNKILYAECTSRTDMDIYEVYYINKWNPCHNTQSLYNCMFSQKLNELTFIELKINLKKNKKINPKRDQRLTCSNVSDFTIINYEVGNNYIEKNIILEFYKTHKTESKEWEYLLKDKQFFLHETEDQPIIFNNVFCNPKDIYDLNNIGLYFNHFSKGGLYFISLHEFIKRVLNNTIEPLKFLNSEIVNKINEENISSGLLQKIIVHNI